MKQIVLIHTVQQMYLTFEQHLREAIRREIKINNILDTFFTSDTNERGYFSQHNLDRFYLTLKSAELTGCDTIVVLCSVLSQQVEKVAPFISVPIIRIDERLGSEAIRYGNRVMVLASTASAIEPTVHLVLAAAEKEKRNISIDGRYDLDAFEAMMRGDMETHDERIIQMGSKVHDADVIVYAQGSMEHTAPKVAEVSGLPVVTAPRLCIQQIKEFVEKES